MHFQTHFHNYSYVGGTIAPRHINPKFLVIQTLVGVNQFQNAMVFCR